MFIVIIGMLDFIPSGGGDTGNLSALRSLRVMRPLRAVTKFPELRFLVVLLLQCIPMLSNVLGLCCFIFFVFGILGVQLYAGVLRGLCYNVDDGMAGDATPAPCTLGGGTAVCPLNYECLLLGENDSRGVVHFDSIGGAVSLSQLTCGWGGLWLTGCPCLRSGDHDDLPSDDHGGLVSAHLHAAALPDCKLLTYPGT